jgi:glycosyltransferase involved in cell wall biosynthesis
MTVTTANGGTPLMVCFSHLRWQFVYQRPQHLMSRAARDWNVLFLEEPVIDDEAYTPRLDLTSPAPGLTVAVPTLPAGYSEEDSVAAQRDLLDEVLLRFPAPFTAHWYYTPRAVRFSLHRTADLCIYDCMDELSAFRGAAHDVALCEQVLFAQADLVFTGGRSLFAHKKKSHPDVHLFPSSVDRHHFQAAQSRSAPEPADLALIPHPRIGFFGVIDERLDTSLTAALADLRPDWQFVMLGPVFKIDADSLPQRPNIHWLGMKTYAELPAYLAYWDCGFMPFALNEATRFISPTKTPEFLAAGLPVISTPIHDVARDWGVKGLVEIAGDPASFAARLEMLLRAPPTGWLARVEQELSHQSWDATWLRMSSLIAKARRTSIPRTKASSALLAEAGNV